MVTPVSQNNVVMGRKGETGFTEGTDLQINTFQEKNSRTVSTHSVAHIYFCSIPIFTTVNKSHEKAKPTII